MTLETTMGHHLFIHENRVLPMRDFDVALARHFLAEGARRLGDEPLADAVSGWKYQGPGVWTGIDESALVDHQPVFEEGIEIAQQLGEEIPLDYLDKKVKLPGGQWLMAQTTSNVVAVIRRLKEHLERNT